MLDGFGISARAASRWVQPRSVDELANIIRRAADEDLKITFRGNGRSYGDAALNAGQLVVDNRGMTRVLSFDRERGTIELEPGATIETMWRTGVPAGYWPHVVPGTMFPTMGGCVAMNIHGKNCFKAGPYGDHVQELDLLTASGELKTLSREQDPELFRATIAGLGLLGAVTRVKLGMKKIESGRVKVRPITTPNLNAMFDCFVERMPQSDYLVGWIDCFAGGSGLGRGLVHQANYLSAAEDPAGRALLDNDKQVLPPKIMGVPRSILWRVMKLMTNDPGMKFVNAVKYMLPETFDSSGTFTNTHVAFAFLLDSVPNWRNAYGDSGFIQYQMFVPDSTARAAMAEALEHCRKQGVVSYLGVFKRHKPDEFLLSHGLDGWSLALDFAVTPGNAQKLFAVTRDLTKIVLDAGGVFYPAKDAVVDADSFARAYGDRLTRFLDIKHRVDPQSVFQNDQARRLGLV
ncbi:MAG: FAD-binding oxidoreductase [Candidatus Eisenbacteria bacterium]|nr:FAD-binding oxidoreductase [Candidatus Eisenbacteria bacterium]